MTVADYINIDLRLTRLFPCMHARTHARPHAQLSLTPYIYFSLDA